MEGRKQLVVRIPVELHDRLNEAARERVVSANLLATWAIERYLDQLVPVDEIVRQRNGATP